MGRRPRNYDNGGIYHIIQRGHNRLFIFGEQLDKAAFLDIVRETLKQMPCNVLYYVLMDNHYHLVIEMLSVPLHRIMQRINVTYSKYYNNRYNCSGTVYGQRYRAFSVLDTPHFFKLILYIFNNPVKAGIVKNPRNYRWCAHLDIVTRRIPIVARERLFALLGSTIEEGAAAYKALIKGSLGKPSQASTEGAFNNELRSETLDMLFEEFMDGQVSVEHVRSASRDAKVVQIRRAFIRLAIDKGYSVDEISKVLHMTSRSIRGARE